VVEAEAVVIAEAETAEMEGMVTVVIVVVEKVVAAAAMIGIVTTTDPPEDIKRKDLTDKR
jgi:hypothetical protein